MSDPKLPPAKVIAEFRISSPTFVVETAIANIWKVRREDGQYAALKVYKKKNMGNESAGFSFLGALDGSASARIFKYTRTTALIEWLSGPSLGDLSRTGQDRQAAKELVAVAKGIHYVSLPLSFKLPKLECWFKALFLIDISPQCPMPARLNVLRSQELARELLSDQHDIRPLHGDLHHDNILLGDRGYCAFDAKGVLGERAYELANAFRNPKGAETLVRDPERVRYQNRFWSEQFDVDQRRLLQWATVKCALSIAWRTEGKLTFDPEFDLLDVFFSILDDD